MKKSQKILFGVLCVFALAAILGDYVDDGVPRDLRADLRGASGHARHE